MSKREPFCKCVFVCDRNEYEFHFRAWCAEEAEFHLREELRSYGVAASGELHIFDPKGQLARRSWYGPAERGLSSED